MLAIAQHPLRKLSSEIATVPRSGGTNCYTVPRWWYLAALWEVGTKNHSISGCLLALILHGVCRNDDKRRQDATREINLEANAV